MKIKKKIAAMSAAVMMAVSGMAVNASAATWQNFKLYYTKGAPSSDVVTSQTLGDNSSPHMFSITTKGQLTVKDNITSFNGTSLKTQGYVYDPTIKIGSSYGAWGLALTCSYSSTGLKSAVTRAYANAYVGNAARVSLKLNYSSIATSASAYGKTTAY